METDRELLELAAKAAGLKIDKSPYNGGGHGNTGFDLLGNAVLDWHNNEVWNPLTKDGDALRLAVKLKLDVEFAQTGTWLGTKVDSVAPLTFESHRGDAYSATRRAIVRAAAEIGKQEKPLG